MIKGAYTLSKAENMADDDGAGVTFNSPSQFDRNMALAGFDRTHNFHVAAVYQLPWQSNGGSHGNVARAIINDWQINGTFAAFSGTPFTVTANGTIVNMPGNQQTGRPGRRRHQNRRSRRAREPTTIRARGRSRRASDSATPGATSSVVPGGVNLDMSLFRAFPMGGARRLEFRVEASNVTNTPKFVNPNGDVNSGNFMRIIGTFGTATSGAYFERHIRFGLRFSF